jgi:uncharacterized protein
MHVLEIWRYPVKSMAGERLDQAKLSFLGIEGDRVVQVRNENGHVITSRTHPGLLGHHAVLNKEGQPLVDGRLWSDPAVLNDMKKIVGPGAGLSYDTNIDRFDVLPLLVATDGAIAEFREDSRRLRPNLVIGGVAGLEERQWPGKYLRIGEVVIRVQDLRGRCVMTTFDPDTLEFDPSVLRGIVRRFGGKLALNCDVVQGGTVLVNQEVELLAHQPAR